MIEQYKVRLAELRASYDEAARKRDEIGAALKGPDKLTPAQAFDLQQKLDALNEDVKAIKRQADRVEKGLNEAVEIERKALEEKLASLN